jgi:hypothetical protein
VRCAVDASLNLPADHPPTASRSTSGARRQLLVHMLMPIGGLWTEEFKQLAQTYVNTASSTLITLNISPRPSGRA